jgi:predicted choloylglycine hydrolase
VKEFCLYIFLSGSIGRFSNYAHSPSLSAWISNGAGVIVGTYDFIAEGSRNTSGFIYIKGTFKDVKLPKFTYSRVEGINDSGYVTGMAFNDSGSETAFTAHCQ